MRKPERREAEEAMLTRYPCEVCWDGDTGEAVFFNGDLGLLTSAVFKESSEPGIDIARHVYSCCGNEVIPIKTSEMVLNTM